MYRLYVHLKLNLFHIFLFRKMNNLTLSPPIKLNRFVKKNHNYTCKTAYSVHVHCNNFKYKIGATL